MELLIPGLIIVALMIYTSTKIKRASTEAFEAEHIETDLFVIDKPEEFLNKIEPSRGLLLEGYTREFGTGDAANLRQAQYEVSRGIEPPLPAASEVIADNVEVIGGRRYRVIEFSQEQAGIGYVEYLKWADGYTDSALLSVTRLADASAEVVSRVESLVNSFIVK